jgi:hypothetical protein
VGTRWERARVEAQPRDAGERDAMLDADAGTRVGRDGDTEIYDGGLTATTTDREEDCECEGEAQRQSS